ncbi:MAG: hypothetical protein O3A14_15735 [Cyanobacteria bacterium]|nr:hypothetical protein [Cyanobacteriota bacterium]
MSEYQYYEFQTCDRPLTPAEQAEIQNLSSRAQVSPNRAVFLYNYGDFRGKPIELVTQYFDIMFYIANWGTWQLIFRFPKAIVDPQWFQPYALDNVVTLTETDEYLVLDVHIYQEEYANWWANGEGWLPRLLPLRDELIQGDCRLLYLAWLRMANELAGYRELEADPVEPPVPPNLGQLSPALKAFIEVVNLDSDLVNAAAQNSPSPAAADSAPPLETHLSDLSDAEQKQFLLKLVRREPHVDLQLIRRLQEVAGTPKTSLKAVPGQRHLSELVAIADEVSTARKQQEKAAARKKRIQELEALAPKAPQTWELVRHLITLKQAKPYDEATVLLKDLRDLAEYQGELPAFTQRLKSLKADYSNRPALMKRLRGIKP